jgi:hypothetical protein
MGPESDRTLWIRARQDASGNHDIEGLLG